MMQACMRLHILLALCYILFFASSYILSNRLPCSSSSNFWENISKNYLFSKVKTG